MRKIYGENGTIDPPFFERASFYEPVCSSTNNLAKAYISKGMKLAEGTVFVTNHQYQGRGQQGSTWVSAPRQNLTFSIILYPSFLTVRYSFFLNVIVSLAIYKVLVGYVPKGLSIKWPNDIYYLDKKLGGILIENSIIAVGDIKSSVVGVGLNVNQDQFPITSATSLKIVMEQDFNLSYLLNAIISTLGTYYRQLKDEGSTPFLFTYLEKLYWMGQLRNFKDQEGLFKGKIMNISSFGELIICKENRAISYYSAKEVNFVR